MESHKKAEKLRHRKKVRYRAAEKMRQDKKYSD
jgi:hypothetical protein